MKFKIIRTSIWDDDEKPCKDAIREDYDRVEIRTVSSFEEFDKKFGKREGNWLSKGINHCINKEGYIQREFPNDIAGWFIDINSLEDLLDFQKEYGSIIIAEDYNNPNVLEIEIYDDYRE